MRRWKLIAIFSVCAVGIGGGLLLTGYANGFDRSKGKIGMNNKGRAESMFNSTKPVCFTRFVVDVPANAEVVFGRMTVDAEIQRYEGQAKEYDSIVEGQIEGNHDAAETFHARFETEKIAESRIATPLPDLVHVVNISGADRYGIHSFLKLGDDVYDLNELGVFGKDVRKILNEHEVLARKFRPRTDDHVPAEDGVCIAGAFANVRPQYETIQVGVRFKEFPDVHFSIEILKNLNYVAPESEYLELFERGRKNAVEDGGAAWYQSIKQIRRGHREVNGWTGYETLLRLPATNDAKSVHQFFFHAIGKKDDPFAPVVDIQLDTGVHNNTPGVVEPSLTDEQAVQIWDKLLGSIRLRQSHPAAGIPGSRASMAITDHGQDGVGARRELDRVQEHEYPVGTVRHSAETCPVSGWWKCTDHRTATEPSRRILIGETMPALQVRFYSTNWRRLFKLSENKLLDVSWELHRHDDQLPEVGPRSGEEL